MLARGANPVATSILLSDFRNRRTRSARMRWACGKWQAKAGDTDVKASSAEARISPWRTALWVVPVCISRIFFLKRCQVDVVTSCHAAQLPLRLLPLLLKLPLLLLPVTWYAAQHICSCRCQLHGQQYNNVWCVQHDGSCIARAPHSHTLVRPTLVCGVCCCSCYVLLLLLLLLRGRLYYYVTKAISQTDPHSSTLTLRACAKPHAARRCPRRLLNRRRSCVRSGKQTPCHPLALGRRG